MGMFDSVIIICDCGEEVEFQSKAGDCLLETFRIDDVPPAIAVDLDGQEGHCRCGRTIQIYTDTIVDIKVVITKDGEET